MESTGVIHIPDVAVTDVWDRLKADPKAVMVDVRTKAEWAFVGVPDLSSLGKRVMTLEWQSFPDSRVDPDFAGKLGTALTAQGVGADDEIFFICRSGGRSRMAAEVLAATGFRHCRNVAEGFRGATRSRPSSQSGRRLEGRPASLDARVNEGQA